MTFHEKKVAAFVIEKPVLIALRLGCESLRGALAEWRGTALQKLLHRFESGTRLQFHE